MESIRKLWCHQCKFEFQNQDINSFKCQKCGDDFCEEMNTQDDPRQFVPYVQQLGNHQNSHQQQQQMLNQQQQQNVLNPLNLRVNNITQTTIHIPNAQSFNIQRLLLDQLFQQLLPNSYGNHQSVQSQDAYFDQIIDFLIRNDPNHYGTPPAAKNVVSNLKKIKFTKEMQNSNVELNQCSVCKEDFKENEEIIQMPCIHLFHNDCLLPWLNLHNSCPTCRYELPTDDEDYERRRTNQQQNNNTTSQSRPRRFSEQ